MKNSFQKRAARAALRQQALGRLAEGIRQHGEGAERRRQQPVDLGAHDLRKHRSGAFRADGDGERRAVDERRREEIAKFRPVDRVHRNACGAGVLGDAAVEAFVACGGKDQRRAVQMGGRIGGIDMFGVVGRDPFAQGRFRVGRDDGSLALDWQSRRALASASSPPPTMTTASPSTRMKMGKALSLGVSLVIREFRQVSPLFYRQVTEF